MVDQQRRPAAAADGETSSLYEAHSAPPAGTHRPASR